MKLLPMHNYVLIQRAKDEEKTKSGLYLPPSDQKKSVIEGTILACGPGKVLDNGVLIEVSVKTGDYVLVDQYSGQEIEFDGEKLFMIKEDQILAVLER